MRRRGEVVGKAVLPTGDTRVPRWLRRWWRRLQGRRRATRALAVLPATNGLTLPPMAIDERAGTLRRGPAAPNLAAAEIEPAGLVCIAVVDATDTPVLDAA